MKMMGRSSAHWTICLGSVARERAHERDPVIIELPEGADTLEVEVLVRTIPLEDRDWMLKWAIFVRYALSLTLPLSHLHFEL